MWVIAADELIDMVFSAGCRLAQGHLFGRAMAISEVSRMLSRAREEATQG